MEYSDFIKLSRRQLIEHFEAERSEWFSLGMNEANIFRIHFGEGNESGRGGDYRIWLDERRHTRPDHKYAPGKPVSLDAVNINSSQISVGNDELCDSEVSIDLEIAVLTLTELQRFCFAEVVLGERTQQSVADDLGITQQVVDKHIRAAKKKLKIFFADRV